MFGGAPLISGGIQRVTPEPMILIVPHAIKFYRYWLGSIIDIVNKIII